VGIGSGILSILLLKQGKFDQVTGTDINPCAIACARDNMQRLGLESRVNLLHADLFPPVPSHPTTNSTNGEMGYDAVLFNPPWLPGDAPTCLDQAVYDPNQMILRRFVHEVQHYVKKEDGCIYILLSNLGMLLGLFREQDLHAMFVEGNLELVEVYHHHTHPTKSTNSMGDDQQKQHKLNDIANTRAREVISLYKLRVKRSR
jgi:methylase of polypeptide subunit release factors